METGGNLPIVVGRVKGCLVSMPRAKASETSGLMLKEPLEHLTNSCPRKCKGHLLLALLTVAMLAPFLNRAFHIDDPLFIWSARQILEHPSDPYGFMVNWYSTNDPMHTVTQNPPLACYYVAGAGAVLGWSESALHAALLLPAIGVILGVYRLAGRLSRRPMAAALATLACPVFLLCSTSIMCDTLMLCFWVWAVVFWIAAMDAPCGGRRVFLLSAASGTCMAAAALTKYFGISLIPLLLIYALTRRRYVPLLALLIPVAVLIAYELWTHHLYGLGLLSQSFNYAKTTRKTYNRRPLDMILLNLSCFTGGCLLPALLFYPLMTPRWLRWPGLLLFILVFVMLIVNRPDSVKALLHGDPMNHQAIILNMHLILQLALFCVGGLAAMIFTGLDMKRHCDADALLLTLWVAGTMVFAGFVNWSINGRSILPMAPALGIILARHLDARAVLDGARPAASWRWLAPLVLSALVGLAAAWADMSVANADRAAAQRIATTYSQIPGRLWFEGHWGFQYCLQSEKAQPLVRPSPVVDPQDLVAIPLNNSFIWILNENVAKVREKFSQPVLGWASVHSGYTGAGFYSDIYGTRHSSSAPPSPNIL